MILKQYYLGCLAHASYLLGDEASSTAIIVDPQRDIELNQPLNHLQERIAEVPRDRRIALHCAGGYRSSIAAGILHMESANGTRTSRVT